MISTLFVLSAHASLQGSERSKVCSNLEALSKAIQDADTFDAQNRECFHLESVTFQSNKLDDAVYKAGNPESFRGMLLALWSLPTITAIGLALPCIPNKLVASRRFDTSLATAKGLRERLQEETND